MSAPNAALLRVCSLLLCLVAGSQQLSITEVVVPDAVEAGKTAELKCQYELNADEPAAAVVVKWWKTPSGSSKHDREQIYQHIATIAPQTIQYSRMVIKENDTIVLLELTPSDSGTYECEVSVNVQNETRKHGELIVYTKGTGPELNISTVVDGPEGVEDLLIECEAARVAPLPQLMVTMGNGNEMNTTQVLTGPSSEGLYSIFASATRRKEDVEAGDISCELLYTNPNISHPQYVDIEPYEPAGGELATTQMPADEAPPDASPESFQNSRDAGYRAHSSWTLPAVAAILVHLHTIII